jgi:hypothetical protein
VPRVVVDADEDETLELVLLLVQDANRRVPRPSQVSSRTEDRPQDGLEIELGDDRPADLEQTLELRATELLLESDAFFQTGRRSSPYRLPTIVPLSFRSCMLSTERRAHD